MIKKVKGGVCAPKGFTAAGIHCGIRKNPGKKDLGLIYSEVPCVAAGMYTQNKVKASPLLVTHQHLSASATAQAILCNSGNANACAVGGDEVAREMCALAADALGIEASEVLVASTGVIGQPLLIEPIAEGMPALVQNLSDSGADDYAQAIMTTDLTQKEQALSFSIGNTTVTLGGVSKGSGMIHPNMATMLGFLTTDAVIGADLLHSLLQKAVNDSFNMISVDGDTSTNDMVLVLANGMAGNEEILPGTPEEDAFFEALSGVCHHLAVAIAADGEGASKLLECTVSGAESDENARALAKSVITSSLFKSAMFGSDANWGRVLCAMGYADTPLEPEQVAVTFSSAKGTVAVCKDGKGLPFDEDLAKQVLDTDKVVILIQVGKGSHTATAWGCDLTYDYVKINGDYRS